MKRVLFFVFGAIFSFMVSPVISSAEDLIDDDNKYNVDISVSPGDILFDIHNMKPGDWAPRDITIRNKGKLDVIYQIQVKNVGDEKLYNEFLLEIRNEKEKLYNGKLADFDQFPPRFLAVNDSENLEITIRFPEHLGNDYQGLGAEFIVQFVAERSINPPDSEDPKDDEEPGNPGQNPDDSKGDSGKGGKDRDVESVSSVVNNSGGNKLPDTATNMFNLIIIGVYLLLAGGLIFLITGRRRKKSSVRRA